MAYTKIGVAMACSLFAFVLIFRILRFLITVYCLGSTVDSAIAISYVDFLINPLCSRYSTVNDINGMRQSDKCCSAFIQVLTGSNKTRKAK